MSKKISEMKNDGGINTVKWLFWRIFIRGIMNGLVKIRNYFFKNSIFIFGDELWMASLFPKKIIDKALAYFNPKSVLDLGCGTGKSLDYFISLGLDAVGVEGSKAAINKANSTKNIIQHNLEKELNLQRKFDLIWSFEFVEHIHPKYIDNLIKTFSNHADIIVMSAARVGQGGDGHFNEQPDTYWIEHFGKYGYSLDREKTDDLRNTDDQFAENMLVFKR